jgi:hypothetical protein
MALVHRTAIIIAGAALIVATVNAAPPATAPSPQRAVLDKYCVTCHNSQLKTAGLTLDALNVDDVSAAPQVWEKVVSKVRTGAMPPPGRPRPDAAAFSSWVGGIEASLDRAAFVKPNYGRPGAVHRLNRLEYTNAVRDLLALDIDGRALLPADDASYGFDNIGDVLSVSPGLLERYILAASKVSWLAIGNAGARPATATYRSTHMLQDDRASEDLPFGSRGGFAVRHTFAVDGEYVIQPDMTRSSAFNTAPRGVHQLQIRLDRRVVKQFEVDGSKRATLSNLQVRLPVNAGTHLVSASFVGEVNLNLTRDFGWAEQPPPSQYVFQNFPIDPIISKIDITGPYNGVVSRDSASRRHIFVCYPENAAAEQACARKIVSKLAARAYRRPAAAADIDPLMTAYDDGAKRAGFEAGVETALEAVLASPKFLFRIERDPVGAIGGAPYRVSDLELASRLSFFLWSSIPDETLVDLAVRGRLKDPAVLAQQVKRMLADPRSKTLASNFGGQWLWQRNLRSVVPNTDLFPEFDDNLRDAMAQETEMFLDSQIREDHSVLDLLTANYTFMNERLAKFYGVSGVYGGHFRRVEYPDDRRAGLLGQASILTVTSQPNRTSPVIRGKWLLETLIGAPPPPPPPNVPPLKENTDGVAPTTVRARLEQHRKNPVCASCHSKIDPLGFALENFDAVGRWRMEDADAHARIDASGALADGTAFNGPAEFRKALLANKTGFASNLTDKLLTYALGRGTDYYDAPVVRHIVRSAAANDYRWSSLVLGIVQSKPFQMRMAAPSSVDRLVRHNDDPSSPARRVQ